MTTISFASYITDDIEGLSSFYADVFDLAEVEELRSDIFRGLDVGGVTLGFSTPVVYEMLGIDAWSDPKGTAQYLTFEVSSDDEVAERSTQAVARGALLLHAPYETYYGAYQAVLSDPANNVFRINHLR